GMMIVEGVDGLFGVDAYNGRVVWEYPIKGILAPYNQEHLLGTAGTHSNMCVADGSVFVRHKDRCLRIDLQTGGKQQEYVMPGARWGFIACDNGTLFGTSADTNYVPRHLYRGSNMAEMLTQSEELFAFDSASGRRLWSYKASQSIRHNAIAIGNGSVFIIDSTLIDADRAKRLGKQDPVESTLLCLDAGTGKVRWRQTNDVYGTTLVLSAQHKMLLMCYQYSQRSFQFGSEPGNRLTGFNAATGERVWDTRLDGKTRYLSRPLINGQTIYAQPLAWDLMTGKPKQDYVMKGRQPGGCGNISGSRHLMLYRSGPLSYIDLAQDEKVNQTYGPMRPGCWINAIPAGGLVLMPDATDGCKCTYLMKVSVGLQPMD
ncbi:MAG: PQQ-like beta-propeller repeat protein, partial [Planctomycetales bacterium]